MFAHKIVLLKMDGVAQVFGICIKYRGREEVCLLCIVIEDG